VTGDDYILASKILFLRKILPEGGRTYLDNRKLDSLDSSFFGGGGLYQVDSKVMLLKLRTFLVLLGMSRLLASHSCGKAGHKVADCHYAPPL